MAIFKDAERSSLAKEHTTRPARAMHNANRSDEDLSIIIHDPDTFLENKVRADFEYSDVVGLGSGPRASHEPPSPSGRSFLSVGMVPAITTDI
jgi:hypothetical protein